MFLIKKIFFQIFFRALVLTANCFLARKTAETGFFVKIWEVPVVCIPARYSFKLGHFKRSFCTYNKIMY